MPGRLILFAAVMLNGLAYAQAAGGGWLPLADQWQSQYPSALRWDELEPPAEHQNAWDAQAPAKDWVVQLPVHSWLRLVSPNNDCGHDIDVLRSNGSGLYAVAERQCSDDGQSSLFPALIGGGEQVLRIRDRRGQRGPLRAFISRVEASPTPAMRLLPVQLNTPMLGLSHQNGRRENYHTLAPDQPALTKIEGPARLLLTSRLYQLDDTQALACVDPLQPNAALGSVEHYRIQLNFQPATKYPNHCLKEGCATTPAPWATTLELDTTPDYRFQARRNSCVQTTSQHETRYLDIPSGHYSLHIKSSRPLLIQLATQDQQPYLQASSNAPRIQAAGNGKDRPLVSDDNAARIEHALHMRNNNARPHGSLNAVAQLSATSSDRLTRQPTARLAEKWMGRHSYWRELIPDAASSQSQQLLARPMLQEFVPKQDTHAQRHISASHLAALKPLLRPLLFSNLAAACPASNSTGRCAEPAALAYHLPFRAFHTQLQLLVATDRIQAPIALWLQFDQEPAQRIELYPADAPPGLLKRAPRLEVALALARAQDKVLFEQHVQLRQQQSELPTLNTADLQLPLAPAARQLRIWSHDPSAQKLQIALQYRVSKAAELSMDEYRQEVERLQPDKVLSLLRQLLRESGTDLGATYLAISEHNAYVSAHQALEQLRQHAPSARLQIQQQSNGQIRYEVQAGPFTDTQAARHWWQASPLTPQPHFRLRSAGLAAAVENLSNDLLGRGTIAQHWLPGLQLLQQSLRNFLAPITALPEPQGLPQAAAVLLSQAQASFQSGDWAETLRSLPLNGIWPQPELAITAMALRTQALRRAGEEHLAEMQLRALSQYGPGLPLRDWASEQLLKHYRESAAHNSAIGLLTARLVAENAQHTGQLASRLSEALHDNGQQDIAHWLAALSPIADRRQSRPDLGMSNKASSVGQETWRWQQQVAWVSAHGGILQTQIHDRDVLINAHRATPDNPVALNLQGPGLLRLKLRPLHTPHEQALNGWIHIRHNDRDKVLAVSNNRPSSGRLLLVDPRIGVGHAIESLIELEDGPQSLTISSPDFALLVELSNAQATLSGSASDTTPGPQLEASKTPQLPLKKYWNTPVCLQPVACEQYPAPRNDLLRAAWHADQQPQSINAQLLAASLALQSPEFAESSLVLQRIFSRSRWQTLLAAPEQTQLSREEIPGWRAFSETQKIRQALLQALPPDAHVLKPGERLNLDFRRLRADKLRLNLQLHTIPGVAKQATEVVLERNHGAPRTIRLPADGRPRSLALSLIPGDQIISLNWPNGFRNQFLSIDLSTENGPLPAQTQSEYWLSEAGQPLTLTIAGPALLKIHQIDGKRVTTTYRHITQSREQLRLEPAPGRASAKFRISSLQQASQPSLETPIQRSELSIDGRPSGNIGQEQDLPVLVLKDELPLGGQEDGTLSVAMSWQHAAQDEDSDFDSTAKRYTEISSIYRQSFEDRHWVMRAQGLLRRHADSSLSQGLLLNLDHQNKYSPWQQAASLRLHHHRLDHSYLGARFSLSSARNWYWSPDWSARIKLQAQQKLTPKVSATEATQLDPAVGSTYASNHPRRLSVDNSLNYTPWLDTRLRLQTRLNSNDPIRELSLDNWYARLEWSQLMGDWDISANARWQSYLPDDHRDQRSRRRQLGMRLSYDRWHRYDRRWALRLDAALEPDRNSYSLGLHLEYSFSNGRLYKDFRSSELNFESIRNWQVRGHVANNRVLERNHAQ